MKIERKEKQFEPVVITIETREELEHLFAAVRQTGELQYNDTKQNNSQVEYAYNYKIYEQFNKLLMPFTKNA